MMSFVTKYEEQIGVSPMYRDEKALKVFQHWKVSREIELPASISLALT